MYLFRESMKLEEHFHYPLSLLPKFIDDKNIKYLQKMVYLDLKIENLIEK